MVYISSLFRVWVLSLAAILLVGCNEKQPDELFLKESDIQSSIDKQLPINGLLNMQIHIPDEVASLSGFFAERVIADPMVDAQIELDSIEVSLVGQQPPQEGRIKLLAEPVIRLTLLGLDIAEPLSIELSGILVADEDKLFFELKELNEKGSFFFNNFVPNDYQDQFMANMNDWFTAYFSAYPVYQFLPDGQLSYANVDKATLLIEDDLLRFLP